MRNQLLMRFPALALGFGISTAAADGTEETIKAFSVWEGEGEFYVAGKEEDIYSATLIGRLYVETEKGPVEAGLLSCPATVHIKLEDQALRGSALCVITTEEGDQVAMSLSCTGVYLVGCSGPAKITGGTGRYKDVAGEGKFTIRSQLADEFDRTAGAAGAQLMAARPSTKVGGILFFENLHYKLP